MNPFLMVNYESSLNNSIIVECSKLHTNTNRCLTGPRPPTEAGPGERPLQPVASVAIVVSLGAHSAVGDRHTSIGWRQQHWTQSDCKKKEDSQ